MKGNGTVRVDPDAEFDIAGVLPAPGVVPGRGVVAARGDAAVVEPD
jgi:hypothetical protein